MREAVMSPKTKARCEARARIIKALSHPTRLFIVDQLQAGKRCVCELTKLIGADTSTVSRHLAVLNRSASCKTRRWDSRSSIG